MIYKYDLKCFIEGIRIPIGSISRTTNRYGVSANIKLVSTPELYQIPPRAHVIVFFKKISQTSVTDDIDKLQTGVKVDESPWKLMFEGYYDQHMFGKSSTHRNVSIICTGVDSYKNYEKMKINSFSDIASNIPLSMSITTFHGFSPKVRANDNVQKDNLEKWLYERSLADSDIPELNPFNIFSNTVKNENEMGAMIGKIISGIVTSNKFLQKFFRTQNILNRYGVLGNKEIFNVMKHTQFVKYITDQLANNVLMNSMTSVDQFFRSIMNELFYEFLYIPSPNFVSINEHRVPDIIQEDVKQYSDMDYEKMIDMKPSEVRLAKKEVFKSMQVALTPNLYFAAPPKCNMMFSNENTSISGGRNFMEEPTRLMVHSTGFLSNTGEELQGRVGYRPSHYNDERDINIFGIDPDGKPNLTTTASDNLRTELRGNSKDSPTLSEWEKKNFKYEDIYRNDEIYKGIIAQEARFLRDRVVKTSEGQNDFDSIFQTQLDDQFANLTQSSTSPTISMGFNPTLVCGLPGCYSDESIGHVLGSIHQIVDTIDVESNTDNTIVNMSKVRTLPFDATKVRKELQHSEIERLNKKTSGAPADYISKDFTYSNIGKVYKKLLGTDSVMETKKDVGQDITTVLSYWWSQFEQNTSHDDKNIFVDQFTKRHIITEGQHMLYCLGARESADINFNRKENLDKIVLEYENRLKSSDTPLKADKIKKMVQEYRKQQINKEIFHRDGNEYYGEHSAYDGPEKSFEPFCTERREWVKRYKDSLAKIPSENISG